MSTDESGEEPGWRILSGQTVYDNPWIRLRRYSALAPTGAPADYALVHFKKIAVGVLPVDSDGSVHLVGQSRFPLGAYSWEAPEGGCELNEDPLECARREMAEESGVRAEHILKIIEMDLSNSVTDEQSICYLAWGLSPASGTLDDVELLRRRRVPFLEAVQDAAEGRIRDSLTVAMLFRAHHMAVTGLLPASLTQAMMGR